MNNLMTIVPKSLDGKGKFNLRTITVDLSQSFFGNDVNLDSLPKTPINTFKDKTDKDRDVWVFFLSNDLVAIKDNNCSAFDSHCKGWKNYYKI